MLSSKKVLCDTPHGLKTSGFCAVAHTDVFSQLLTSYAGMRPKPYPRGGCHHRNHVRDTKFLTILVPDVHGSNHISMGLKATLATAEVASLYCTLAPVSTLRACPAGVSLLLQGNTHPVPFGFVGEHVPN